jgi:hypothetical protein
VRGLNDWIFLGVSVSAAAVLMLRPEWAIAVVAAAWRGLVGPVQWFLR